MIKHLAAVIPAGGLQTRFRPITADFPKSMVALGNNRKPHLEYLLEHLIRAQIGKIIIATGFLSDVLERAFLPWQERGVEILQDPPGLAPPGTGGAMKNVLKHIMKNPCREKPIWDVLYWNPDTLIHRLDPVALYKEHNKKENDATIVLTTDPKAPNFGAVKVTNGGTIEEFSEGVSPVEGSAHRYAHAGAGIFKIPALLEIFEQNFDGRENFCLFRELLPSMVKSHHVSAYVVDGPFYEYGTAKSGVYDFLCQHPELVEQAYKL